VTQLAERNPLYDRIELRFRITMGCVEVDPPCIRRMMPPSIKNAACTNGGNNTLLSDPNS
jgi:hypothetical protein